MNGGTNNLYFWNHRTLSSGHQPAEDCLSHVMTCDCLSHVQATSLEAPSDSHM
jgi:hypothetical protein